MTRKCTTCQGRGNEEWEFPATGARKFRAICVSCLGTGTAVPMPYPFFKAVGAKLEAIRRSHRLSVFQMAARLSRERKVIDLRGTHVRNAERGLLSPALIYRPGLVRRLARTVQRESATRLAAVL